MVYNLNPADNYVIATMIGNFQDGSVAGKIQFGSGWWFLDQQEAMRWQMNALSNCGLISRFIGMLTDSRSFLSYPRHEYFRRTLCDLFGGDMEAGRIPNDDKLVGPNVNRLAADAPILLRQELHGEMRARKVASGHGEIARLFGAAGKNDRIEIRQQGRGVEIDADIDANMEAHAFRLHLLDRGGRSDVSPS